MGKSSNKILDNPPGNQNEDEAETWAKVCAQWRMFLNRPVDCY